MSSFLTAWWRHLVLLNWRVPDSLVPAPAGTVPDHHDGSAWLSLVAFLFHDTRVMGVPVPFHVDFEEVNLRTYVRRDVPDLARGEPARRGVVFIRELVPRFAIAAVARWVYGENYADVPMDHALVRGGAPVDAKGPLAPGDELRYGWGTGERRVDLRALVGAGPRPLSGQSLFLAEHYWGYARQADGGTVEYEVVHPPWRAFEAEVQLTGAVTEHYPPAYAEVLARPPDVSFVAEGSAVEVRGGERIVP